MQEKSTAFEKKKIVAGKSYIFLGFLIGETIRKTELYRFQTEVRMLQIEFFSICGCKILRIAEAFTGASRCRVEI